MKKIRMLVFIGVQLCALLAHASTGPGDNVMQTRGGLSSTEARDMLISSVIDAMAGAHNPNSIYYDKEFAQATKNDLYQMFLSTRRLVQHEDFEKLIIGLDKLLALNDDPDPRRNTLAAFLKQVLKGTAPLSGADTLKGMLVALASIDTSLFVGESGIIAGLKMMSTNNIYGQKIARADVTISALRALLYMIACADFEATLVVEGHDTRIKILSLVESPDHPPLEAGTVSSQTTNIAQWFIGEIVTAIRWGREGNIKLNGAYVKMDQFQAYDWLMYKKRYQLSGVGYEPLKFQGVVGLVSHTLVQSLMPAPVIDAFPSMLELGGGMSRDEFRQESYAGFTTSSWMGRYGTAGRRHKFLALFTPLMEYFWNARDEQGKRRVADLIAVLASLNEMPSAAYLPLTNGADATFRNDDRLQTRSVIKTLETSGLITSLLSPHGKDDEGLAPPALDLFVRVIAKLDRPGSAPAGYRRLNPAFTGETLLDAVFAETARMNAQGPQASAAGTSEPVERTIAALFNPLPGQTKSLVSTLGAGLHVAARTTLDKAFVAAFKADLHNLVDAAQNMVMSADLEHIYEALDRILSLNDNPDPGRNTLARFMDKAIRGLAPISDGDSIKGLIIALSNIDERSLQDSANLNNDLIMVLTTNMYGQRLDSADVGVCELRTLLFLITVANVEQHLKLAGIDTGIPLLNLVDSPDHPYGEPGTVRDQTVNISQWAIGEIVTAIRWGREGKFKVGGSHVTLDEYQAYDWLMYKKRYTLHLAGMKLMTFNGMAGLMSSGIVQLFLPAGINDTFPSLVDLGGGMTDAEYAGGTYSGFTYSSWLERYGTAGRRHKFLALVAPLMEFCWNAKDSDGRQRSGDLVQVLAGLNEIAPETYARLKKGSTANRDATLRRDDKPSVLKVVQDSNLLVYLVQARGENDVLVPAMTLFKRVVAKLNEKDSGLSYRRIHPDFQGNTLMDALFAELDIQGYTANDPGGRDIIGQGISYLFRTAEGESRNPVAKIQHSLRRIIYNLYAEPERPAALTPTMRRGV